MNKVSKDILRMNGMKVNKYISKAIFTGPDRDIYRTHLYRTYFGQGLGYVQDKMLWTTHLKQGQGQDIKGQGQDIKTVWS